MSDSLIEQVKRLAEAKAHYARTGSSLRFDDLARDKLDFPALLAHMQAQQAVVDAARALDGFNTGDCYEVEIEDYETLTAALEKVNGHEQ